MHLHPFCFVYTPRPYKLCLPHVHINDVPIVYGGFIKYLGFPFSINHRNHDDMLRQMNLFFYNSSTKALVELGISFCGSFYCTVIHGLNTIRPLFLRFALRKTTYIVRFCMFPHAVVPVKCL